MELLKTLSDLQRFQNKVSNQTIALVPTMGALHEGHLSLVKEGMNQADICLPYIFLNPTQFSPEEDLESYPNTLNEDLEKLKRLGIQYVWLPDQKDIYPAGIKITHHASDLSKPLEGKFRPHFFDGVVTVLYRMFSLSKPNKVIMGEKDFQQLQVVKDFVKQEKMNIDIIGIPTDRDKDGLALSSRNIYLSKDEYQIAIQLNKILYEFSIQKINEKQAYQQILEAGFDKVDYCAYVNESNFKSENPNRVLAAVWLGKTRLIDNFLIKSNR